MTKEEFLKDCESNLIFEVDNIHTSINDEAFCPFCGEKMKWDNHLYCDCKDQKAFFETQNQIKSEIDSLNGKLSILKSSFIEKTLPFFSDMFLKQLSELRKSLDKDEEDLLKFTTK